MALSVTAKIIEGVSKVWLHRDGAVISGGYPLDGLPTLGKAFEIPSWELEALKESANRQIQDAKDRAVVAYRAICPQTPQAG